MQTFLPYPDFDKSAQCLDYRRLGKQRVETLQILQCLSGEKIGWKNHPAIKQWIGYEKSLAMYGISICLEWIKRGYKDTCLDKIKKYIPQNNIEKYPNPTWIGNEEFHASHRSNLLRKDPIWYSQFKWTEPDNLPYIWNDK